VSEDVNQFLIGVYPGPECVETLPVLLKLLSLEHEAQKSRSRTHPTPRLDLHALNSIQETQQGTEGCPLMVTQFCLHRPAPAFLGATHSPYR
jgi:hypothetical protein